MQEVFHDSLHSVNTFPAPVCEEEQHKQYIQNRKWWEFGFRKQVKLCNFVTNMNTYIHMFIQNFILILQHLTLQHLFIVARVRFVLFAEEGPRGQNVQPLNFFAMTSFRKQYHNNIAMHEPV